VSVVHQMASNMVFNRTRSEFSINNFNLAFIATFMLEEEEYGWIW